MLALSCVSDSNSMQCGDSARHCKEQIKATETSRVEAEKTPATRLFRKERQAPTLPVFSGRRQRQHRRIAQSPSRPGYLIEPLTGLGCYAFQHLPQLPGRGSESHVTGFVARRWFVNDALVSHRHVAQSLDPAGSPAPISSSIASQFRAAIT